VDAWVVFDIALYIAAAGCAIWYLSEKYSAEKRARRHDTLGQWLAAGAVGIGVAGWRIFDNAAHYLTPRDVPQPTGGMESFAAGYLAAAVLCAAVTIWLFFDEQLGRFGLYRFVRIFLRGLVFGVCLLAAIATWTTFKGM
jgi:hypothetical protein